MDSAVIIGNLDGVHRGHQALVRQARALADEGGLWLRVLTFHPHPSEVLRGEAPPRLTTLDRKIALLRHYGVDEVTVEPFTREFSAVTPEAFVRDLLVGRLSARAVLVGEDFRFGARRAGDLTAMRAWGRELGFAVVAASVVGDARGPFSSSRVRAALARGDLDDVTHVLGRRHVFSGRVVRGDQLGRKLGFPTANLADVDVALPAHGVYAVLADGRPAVLNVGMRPTVDGTSLRVEVHVLDFDGDLYDRTLRVELVARLRDERKFDGLSALTTQIRADVEAARSRLSGLVDEGGP